MISQGLPVMWSLTGNMIAVFSVKKSQGEVRKVKRAAVGDDDLFDFFTIKKRNWSIVLIDKHEHKTDSSGDRLG